jgi:hypothetical protein
MKFKGVDDKVHYTILHKDDKDFFFISNYEDYTMEIEFDFGGKGSVILGPNMLIANQIHYWEKNKRIGMYVKIDGIKKGHWCFTYDGSDFSGKNW